MDPNPYAPPPPRPKQRRSRLAIGCGVVILCSLPLLVFLAIWQFLSPGDRPSAYVYLRDDAGRYVRDDAGHPMYVRRIEAGVGDGAPRD